MEQLGGSLTHNPVILAIETAGMVGSVALVADGMCIAENSLQSHLTHSRRLLVGIDQLMEGARLSLADIDAVVVSMGPGSFTGLRIGLSTAKGLIMATEKPLIGVSTLDSLACQLMFVPQLICPILDARKKEVFCALYRCDAQGYARRTSDYMVLSPERLAEEIHEPTVFVGDGIQAYGSLFKSVLGDNAMFSPTEIFFPRAASIGMLAISKFRERNFLDPVTATPTYIRASDAELNFGKLKK